MEALAVCRRSYCWCFKCGNENYVSSLDGSMEEVGDFEDSSNNQDIFIQINWPSSVVNPPNQPNMD